MIKSNESLPEKIDGTDLLNQEHIEQIWAERAAQMAQVEAPVEPGETLVVVLVRLGRELFGLEVTYVTDIRPKEALTHVPRTPDWIAGVMNLRGRILSVIDLRAYLGLPPSAEPPEGVLVVVELPTMEVILLVDDVPGVEVLPICQDLSEDTLLHHLPMEYVRAMVEYQNIPGNQRHATVLDVQALLSDRRLVVHEDLA